MSARALSFSSVHTQLAFADDLFADPLRHPRLKGPHLQADQPGGLVVGHLDDALPVPQQILDIGIRPNRENRVRVPVLGIDPLDIDRLVDLFDDLLTLDELIEDVGIRGRRRPGELGQSAQQVGSRLGILLAHREPRGRGILVKADEIEIPRDHDHRHENEQDKAEREPPMPALHSGGSRLRADFDNLRRGGLLSLRSWAARSFGPRAFSPWDHRVRQDHHRGARLDLGQVYSGQVYSGPPDWDPACRGHSLARFLARFLDHARSGEPLQTTPARVSHFHSCSTDRPLKTGENQFEFYLILLHT